MEYAVHGVTKNQTQLSDFHFQEAQEVRFRVSGRWELTVTFPETLGLWLRKDYAQWPVHAYEVYYASAAVNSSLAVSCETNHLPDCLRTSEMSRFFHSLLSNCLSLMGKRTVWSSLSEKSSNKWKECFKYLCYFNTEIQDCPKFGLFQNHSFQRERPNYFQIIGNILFHNQISNFGGINFVLLMRWGASPVA